MSGFPEQAALLQGLLSDGQFFLQKPIAPSLLAERIRRLVDAPDVQSTD